MGVITTDKLIAEDAINFFNYLSGYSVKPEYNKLIVAPFDIRDVFIDRIDKEIASHRQHGNGKIMMKMNSLTDKAIIENYLKHLKQVLKFNHYSRYLLPKTRHSRGQRKY